MNQEEVVKMLTDYQELCGLLGFFIMLLAAVAGFLGGILFEKEKDK